MSVTKNTYVLLLIHAKQLLLAISCDATVGLQLISRHTNEQTDGMTDGQTGVEVETVTYIHCHCPPNHT